jgi:hypothetical protein
LRLLHIYFLVEITVEESRFNIKLNKLQILERDYAEEKTEGGHLYDG